MAALDPAKVEDIRRLAADGVSAYRIAKTVGCALATVHKYAPAGSFDRSSMAAAVKAHSTDMAARRAVLAEKLLEDAARLREQLWRPALVYNFGGKDNTYEEHLLERPSFADQRNLVQAATTAMNAHLRLVDHDSDGGLDEARSVLDGFMDAVAQKASQLLADGPQ